MAASQLVGRTGTVTMSIPGGELLGEIELPLAGGTERFLARAAALLRAEDLDASPASVIEAARLADMLAGLRGRARPPARARRHADRATATARSGRSPFPAPYATGSSLPRARRTHP